MKDVRFLFSKRTAMALGVATLANSACAVLPNPPAVQPQVITEVTQLPTPVVTPPVVVAPVETTAMSASVHAFLLRSDAVGQEVLVPVTPQTQVTAGDVLEYQVHFDNVTGERLRKAQLNVSIPEELEFIGAVVPAQVMASIDGQAFSRMPLRTRVDGQLQPVALSFYRVLRWEVEDIGIGGTAVVKYRAKLK